jgi:hypothetical protein
MQPESEFRARRSKEIQGKKACISLDSFGGIGAFQRVMSETNKKIFSA